MKTSARGVRKHVQKPRASSVLTVAASDMTSEEIAAFIAANHWKFAKTMPHNPHEYCRRKDAVPNEAMFERFVTHIRKHGYRMKYNKGYYTCFDFGEHFFWTMGWPLAQTVLINRKPLTAKDSSGDAVCA